MAKIVNMRKKNESQIFSENKFILSCAILYKKDITKGIHAALAKYTKKKNIYQNIFKKYIHLTSLLSSWQTPLFSYLP